MNSHPETPYFREQYAEYSVVGPDQNTFDGAVQYFNEWLAAVEAEIFEAGRKAGRDEAYAEVDSTLDGQEELHNKIVADYRAANKTGKHYINESFVEGIAHARGVVKANRHLQELPEGPLHSNSDTEAI